MRRDKANQLVNSIINTHIAALNGVSRERAAEALENARTDLHGLVDQIYGDFDSAAEQALQLLDDAGADIDCEKSEER